MGGGRVNVNPRLERECVGDLIFDFGFWILDSSEGIRSRRPTEHRQPRTDDPFPFPGGGSRHTVRPVPGAFAAMFGSVQPTQFDLVFSLFGFPVRVIPWF